MSSALSDPAQAHVGDVDGGKRQGLRKNSLFSPKSFKRRQYRVWVLLRGVVVFLNGLRLHGHSSALSPTTACCAFAARQCRIKASVGGIVGDRSRAIKDTLCSFEQRSRLVGIVLAGHLWGC